MYHTSVTALLHHYHYCHRPLFLLHIWYYYCALPTAEAGGILNSLLGGNGEHVTEAVDFIHDLTSIVLL